jgi:competence protein ComEC
MQRFLLSFCCGALLLSLPWPAAWPWPQLVLAISAAALAAWSVLRALGVGDAYGLLAAGALLGVLWSALAHADALGRRSADVADGNAIAVSARVISEPVELPAGGGQLPGIRFHAEISSSGPTASLAEGTVARLSWYGAPTVRAGDEWALRVVLRGPWSYTNPAGFDYERWLLGAGIQATGYVRSGTLQSRPEPTPMNRLRASLTEALAASGLLRQGVLLALLTGNTSGISEAQWDLFRATGTVHLMVISGLHVGLAAGLGFALGRWACVLCPPVLLWLDGRKAGCCGGVITAGGYVALAGAGLPAMRALIMAAGVLILLGWGRSGAPGRTLVVALAILLLLQPLAVHQQGFWLSFGAVVILIVVLAGRYGTAGRWQTVLRPQLALSLGMLPLVAFHTGDVPWAGVPANLVAVPAVSLCVVPAVLLGGALAALWPDAAGVSFRVADGVLGLVLVWLEWLAAAPRSAGAGAGAPLLAAQAAALWWMLGAPARYLPVLALCLALPLAPRPSGVAEGEYRVTALDVGQGAATLIETRRHRLLFDAGPGFPGGFETGSAVVVPNLLAAGAQAIDTLVLSHDHLDHTGGANAVAANLQIRRRLTSTPRDGSLECHGRRWRWDGVSFRLLQLQRPPRASENDRSCVLLVDNGRARAVLGGDIGSKVEAALLRALLAETEECLAAGGDCGAGARVHLVFAPHHGSATSSSPALVRGLAPSLVFVEAGRNNRFGHPHAKVVERYERVGARLYQTGRHGALVWTSAEPDRVVRWRQDRGPYWRSQEPGS